MGSYTSATSALTERLDPGNKVLASQDFRHAAQSENEDVSDYVRRLERVFYTAFGKDKMGAGTREAILYGQLHEGLKLSLMKSPSVSGSLTYRELIMAAKNEERCQAEFKKRVEYNKGAQSTKTPPGKPMRERTKPPETRSGEQREQRECYVCRKVGHIAKDCPKKKSESTNWSDRNRSDRNRKIKPGAKQVVTGPPHERIGGQSSDSDPREFLYSDSDSDEAVNQVKLCDKGSRPQHADIQIQGVTVMGVIDTGADITIMNGTLFKKVAATAKLKKKQFKKADKCPRTYDRRQFSLDGRLDLDLTFGDKTMTTPVYIKMDAHEELLLSEGVCSQLGIVTYHSDVHPGTSSVEPKLPDKEPVSEARVPLVRVLLCRSYGKPCGSKIESTKHTVIMPKNVRVLAINVRVFYKTYVFHYKRTCQVISSLESRLNKIYIYFNRPSLEARLYIKHLASDRVASIQGRLESRLVTERLAQKANCVK